MRVEELILRNQLMIMKCLISSSFAGKLSMTDLPELRDQAMETEDALYKMKTGAKHDTRNSSRRSEDKTAACVC